MSERRVALVMASLAGATMGAPHVRRQEFVPLTGYEPVPFRMAPAGHQDLAVVWAYHLRQSRPHSNLSGTYRAHWNSAERGDAYALANLAAGLGLPLSGQFGNPASGRATGLARALFWGIRGAGKPELASLWAATDMSVDHAGDALWVAAWVAAAAATAASENGSWGALLGLIPKYVPAGHPALAKVPEILGAGISQPASVSSAIPEDFSPASRAFLHILAALSGCQGQASRAMILAASLGHAASDTAAIAAALGAGLYGPLEPEWTGPLGQSYVATGFLQDIDPPATLAAYAELFDGDLPEASALDLHKHSAYAEVGPFQLHVHYPQGPIFQEGRHAEVELTLINREPSPMRISPEWVVGAGLEVASDAKPETIAPGAAWTTKAKIVAPQGVSSDQVIELRTEGLRLSLPVLATGTWSVIGPYPNQNDAGMSQAFAPEQGFDPNLKDTGRAELPVAWQAFSPDGPELNLESLFRSAPGVVYVFSQATMPAGRQYRLRIESPVPARIWLDDQAAQEVAPDHPCEIALTGHGPFRLMLKVGRQREDMAPVLVAFFDQEGHLVRPARLAPTDDVES